MTGVARALAAVSLACAVTGVALAASHANRWRVLAGLGAGPTTTEIGRAVTTADGIVNSVSAMMFALAIAEFVLLVVWTWRMALNVRAAGLPARMVDGLAIGGYFIPVANAVIPFLFFRDFVKSLNARDGVNQRRYSVMIWWWWLQIGALFFTGSVDEPLSAATLDRYIAADQSLAAGRIVFAVSAALGAMTFARFARDAFPEA